MDFSVVITHLQSLYPGQLVLYVDDIAKILGNSEKAIAHLIARDRLPFKVKKVGEKRCVDIFQIAQWLAADSVLDEAAVTYAESHEPRKVKPKARKASSRNSSLPALDAAPQLTGNLAAEILKMRHQSASQMGRFVYALKNNDEFLFMHEVLEKLFYVSDLLSDAFCVTVQRLPSLGSKASAEELKKYFPAEQPASLYLVAKLDAWRFEKSRARRKMVQHFQLTHAGITLFHAVAVEGRFTCVENGLQVELVGF